MKLSGSASRPRSTIRPFQTGCSSTSSRSGNRRASAANATRPFDAGQRRTETVVDAAAERHVLGRVGPAEIQLVGGVAPVRGVVVGAGEAREHEAARFDHLAVELEVPDRDPARELHRAVEAEELVDRGVVETGIGAQPLELVAVAEQRQGAVADEVHRRLVAGDVEEHHLVDQLLLVERVAVLLGGDEPREQIVGRCAPLRRDDLEHVLPHRFGAVRRGPGFVDA